ncbi:potassium/proton antiporter [Nesterenkonia xinjiangensis]|uniref:Cell volume regulation protein A n=1 Tax=Nesterenkonia xinjiangensis TaxID=225327 RepID=A0A7Z0KAH6_9MICC|nr:potassium/proton antiporter [Nesterenkonia xinjiangensis]NYJ78305.1 cell volume regulation protein A [Nesterenkonia xinjiangensis]
MDLINLFMLAAPLVMLVAIGGVRVGTRLGLPALLLFLLVGIILGESGFGFEFDDAVIAQGLGYAALTLILAEGGLSTKWEDIRPTIGLAAVLATVGVLVTIGLMTVIGHYALGLPLILALLFGAVNAGTDAAAVFSVLRGIPLPARVRSTLEGESGLNDAPTVLIVAAATAAAVGEPQPGGIPGVAVLIMAQLVGGIMLGIALGALGVFVLRRFALPAAGLYPIAALAWAVLAYGVATQISVSGFAAVYICAMFLGNGRLPHRHATQAFAEGTGWLAQIGLFVMLGMLASPSRITWDIILLGLVAGLFLTFVVRPVAVVLCAVWFRIPWREQAFLSWAGLRGAVPIILATVPMAAHLDDADRLFDVVLVFVIAYTAIQAPSLPWVARKLGLVDDGETTAVIFEPAPMDEQRADLFKVKLTGASHLAGTTLELLDLPDNADISLVIREDTVFVPDGATVLQAHDELLVVAPADHREAVESCFHRHLGGPEHGDGR